MNRCASVPRRAALLLACACLASTLWVPATQAQTARNFPRNALRGEVVFIQPPTVALNGVAARMAPGAHVHGQNNMLQTSGALAGNKWTVNYTLDMNGQLHEVWLLLDSELARQPWPRTLAESRSWSYDGQLWTKP